MKSGKSLSVVELSSGDKIAQIKSPEIDNINRGWALGPEGRYLAVGLPYGVEVIDTRSSDRLVLPIASEDLAFSPNGRHLAVAMPQGYTQKRKVGVWEILSLSEAFHVTHSRPLYELRLFSEPPMLISFTRSEGEWWSEVRVLGEGFPRRRSDLPHGAGSGWISRKGHHLAILSKNTVQFWNVPDGRELRTVSTDSEIVRVWFEEDGMHAALDNGDTVQVVDLSSSTTYPEFDYSGQVKEIRLSR
jgi:WD40 repeat protein